MTVDEPVRFVRPQDLREELGNARRERDAALAALRDLSEWAGEQAEAARTRPTPTRHAEGYVRGRYDEARSCQQRIEQALHGLTDHKGEED